MPTISISSPKLAAAFKGKRLLLDTNILIYQLNGQFDLSEALVEASSLHLSAISQSELYAGTPQSELMLLRDYLTEFKIEPVTGDIATLAGAYKAALVSWGLKDLLIAATAELHKLTLVTANRKDFKGINTISPILLEI